MFLLETIEHEVRNNKYVSDVEFFINSSNCSVLKYDLTKPLASVDYNWDFNWKMNVIVPSETGEPGLPGHYVLYKGHRAAIVRVVEQSTEVPTSYGRQGGAKYLIKLFISL